MSLVDAIGYIGAVLTTAAFLRQALQILRPREIRHISLVM